jgi:hypothetical protein
MQALSSTSTSCWDSVVEAVDVVYNAPAAGYARATGKSSDDNELNDTRMYA